MSRFFFLEYSVIMFDGITGEKRWNVTFFDYASQPAKENEHGNLLFGNFVINLKIRNNFVINWNNY